MASFNEWLHRRDEVFHQDRFDKAMGREAGRILFNRIDLIKSVIDKLGRAVGQLTRIKDRDIANKLELVLDKFVPMRPDALGKEENMKDLYMALSDAESKMKTAEKGMPDPTMSSQVAKIMKLLEKMGSRLAETGGKAIFDHPMRFGGTSDEINTERNKFLRHAKFKRSGAFSPENLPRLPARHSPDFNIDDIPVIHLDDE